MDNLNDLCFSYSGECAVPFVNAPGFSEMVDIGVNIVIPKARECTPDCCVQWNFGGMDIFGSGFSLSLPYFERVTTQGVPNYDCSDIFRHSSYGVLCAGESKTTMRYYPRVDRGAARIEYMTDTDTFRETLRDGTVTLYTERVLSSSGLGFLYYPTSVRGPRGTSVCYHYLDSGEIASIEYEDIPKSGYAFVVDFSYEARQDARKSFRGGFLYERALRCTLVTISSVFEEKRKLRAIAFEYDDKQGCSRLSRITETAFLGDEVEEAPSIGIAYEDSGEAIFSDITASFAGVDIGMAQPISMHHEGACGLLALYAFGAYYAAPNYSDNDMPCFAPKVLLEHMPAGFQSNGGIFLDLDGDGEVQWIAPDGNGYYAMKGGQFAPFTPFESICPINNRTEYADIYGDGRLSAFTVTTAGEQTQCEIYKGLGRKGFGKAQIVSLPKDFPASTTGKLEFVGFARFFGDGMQHRIVLQNKSCKVFPNLGGGHFGEGINIQNAPEFGSDFDAARIRFADTTGSGTDDIIYIEQTQIHIYQNIAGAYFAPPITIKLPESFTSNDSMYLADFIGDLLPQLIFIKRGVSGIRVYSLRFSNYFLVNGIENGSKLKIEVEYTSSAKFILKDTAQNHLWSSVLPFHIPVVSKLSCLDQVTGERNTIDYAYRDGRYIQYSRSVYGFGTVEEKHTNTVPLPAYVPKDLLPPAKLVINEYYIGDSDTPTADVFALIGLPLTTKYVHTDGTVLMQHQYVYRATALWGAIEGSYFPALVEEDTMQCGEQPRICKTYYTYDDYGNVTVLETHALAQQEENTGVFARAEQRTEYISIIKRTYINIDTTDTLLLGLPASEQQFAGTKSDNTVLVSLQEYYYADPISGDVLPFGSCKAPALLHHTRDLVLSADDASRIGLEETLLNQCGYCLEEGNYYISNAVYAYDATCFYCVQSVTLDNSVTNIVYDSYGIFVTRLEHVLSNSISLVEQYIPDYSVCAYQAKIDVNGNPEYYLYDAFGQLRGLSYTAAVTKLPNPTSLEDLIAHPETYLTDGIDAYLYNYRGADKTPCHAAIIRKDTTSAWMLCLHYADGHGRTYGQAVRDTDSWIISERNIYAGDMKILEYPSYYGQDPLGEPNTYPTAYQYDILGRIVNTLTPYSAPSLVWLSQKTEYKPWYVRTTDARLASSVCCFRHDLDSRGLVLTDVYESADGDILRSKITRDDEGSIVSLSDGRLAATANSNLSLSYDCMKRVIKTVSADAGTQIKLYGSGGRLMYEDTNGTAKMYAYDALGRFVSLRILTEESGWTVAEQVIWGETVPDAQKKNLIGQIYQHTDQSGTVTYQQYDRFGHALEMERSYTEKDAVKAQYAYNLAGELIAAETESFSLVYTYSPAGRLSAVSTSEGDALTSLRYTAQGDVCSETGDDGISISYSYHPVTRLLSAQSVEYNKTLLYKAEYDFTAQGNLAAVTSKTMNEDPLTASFVYDVHSRLIHAAISQGIFELCEDYGYDNSGNLLSYTCTKNASIVMTRNYEIAADSNRIAAVVINGTRYEYNYNNYGGPEQLPDGQQLSYDAFGRVSAVNCDEYVGKYTYDASGSRTGKVDSGNKRTIYFQGHSLAGDYTRVRGDSETLLLNIGGMRSIMLVKSGTNIEKFSQITDQRGSVLLTVNRNGAIVLQEYFSPYGEEINNQTHSIETDVRMPYRFAGKEYDSKIGLYYFGARYYSPEDGRMITPDAVEYASFGGLSGLNLYAYCLDNPETLIDSTGNWPSWIAAVAGKIAEGAVVGGIGFTLGRYINAITPFRATAVAAISAFAGSLIFTPGDIVTRLASAAVTGLQAGAYTAGTHFVKETVLHYKPKLAEEHPKTVAGVVSAVTAGEALLTSITPGGSAVSKGIGVMGGGALGVVGAFTMTETGIGVSPKTVGNRIVTEKTNTHFDREIDGEGPILRRGKYDMSSIEDHGVVDFSFYIDRCGEFHKKYARRDTRHRVIEYNATEVYQWEEPEFMANMMGLKYRDSNGMVTKGQAKWVVIVHGDFGGHAFIDGDLMTHGISMQTSAPDQHTLIEANALADDLCARIKNANLGGKKQIIKLISCHGAEGWPIMPATAQMIANRTNKWVAAYQGAISIEETMPSKKGYQIAKIFKPQRSIF